MQRRATRMYRTSIAALALLAALLGPAQQSWGEPGIDGESAQVGTARKLEMQRLSEEGGELAPADQLAWAARMLYGQQFAGVSLSEDGRPTVHVALEGLYGRQDVPQPLQVVDPSISVLAVRFTEAELKQAFDRVVADEQVLRDDYGVILTHVGVDEAANRVAVDVDNLAPATAQLLRQRYGEALQLGELAGPVGTAMTRGNDRAPAKGGARVASELDRFQAPCSTGFVWTTGPSDRDNVVSATHCTGPGLDWRNNGNYYGTTVEASAETGNKDWALVDLNRATSARVYSSDIRSRVVYSFFTDYASGVSVCQSGSTTGREVCGFNVIATDECVQLSYPPPGNFSQLTCGLNFAFKSGSAPAISGGDSGGPVYRRNPDDSVTAAGIIVGLSTANPSIFFFTPIVVIRNGLDGGPYTCSVDPDTTCPGGE